MNRLKIIEKTVRKLAQYYEHVEDERDWGRAEHEYDVDVYRVQNKQKKGPFEIHEQWADKDKKGEPRGHQDPFGDPYFSNAIFDMISDKEDEGEPVRYGFKDREQVNHYFSKTELKKLSDMGYKLERVPAKEAWHGKTQTIFLPR